MKFGLISLDFRRFPLEFCFQTAARYGFDGVELWAGRPHAFPRDMDAARIREVLDWKRAYRLETPMLTPNVLGSNYRLTAHDEREREEAIALFEEHIRLAARLDCPAVLVVLDHPGCNLDPDETWRLSVDSVRRLADCGARCGVRVVIEPLTPMESPVVTTSDDCVRLLRAVGRDNVDAMLDVAPPTVAYEPFSDYFTKLEGRMSYIHVCNTDGATDAHTRLDNGVLPIPDLFELFRQWGYDGFVTAELYSECYRDPELLAANTARVLREAGAMAAR